METQHISSTVRGGEDRPTDQDERFTLASQMQDEFQNLDAGTYESRMCYISY